MKKAILLLLFLLSLSICLNLFQWSNAAVTCENIDAHWKVDSPYTSIYPPTTTTASNG